MRLAYLDCFSGVTGAMVLSALVDAGADPAAISRSLEALPIGGVDIRTERVEANGVPATRSLIHAWPQAVIRTYANLRTMLEGANLPPGATRIAQRMLRRLAEADAKVREKEVDVVTFHEYGDIECLVEFVGTALALEELGVERVFASPVPTGLGMARTAHGMMPIPTPVVMELLQNVPTYSRGVPAELVTATGAAILAAVSEGFGDMPMMRADRVGYGAGHLRQDFPNVVRVVIGEEERVGGLRNGLAGGLLIEVNLSDGGTATQVVRDIHAAGALEAWTTPIGGGDGRTAATISAIVPAARREAIIQVMRALPGGGAIRVSSVEVSSPGS